MSISFVGLIHSAVAFLVTQIFPWELATVGISKTFLIYGLFAAGGPVIVMRIHSETRVRTLAEPEKMLART